MKYWQNIKYSWMQRIERGEVMWLKSKTKHPPNYRNILSGASQNMNERPRSVYNNLQENIAFKSSTILYVYYLLNTAL